MWKNWALKIFTLVFGVGAFLFSVIGGGSGPRRHEYIVYGMVCVAATTVVAYFESGASLRSLEQREHLALAEVRLQERVVRAASAAASHAARISGLLSGPSAELTQARGRLDQAVCGAAAQIHSGSRAAFYLWQPTRNRFGCAGIWPGSPTAVERIPADGFGFPVLRHVLRTGGVFRAAPVRTWATAPPEQEIGRARAAVGRGAGRSTPHLVHQIRGRAHRSPVVHHPARSDDGEPGGARGTAPAGPPPGTTRGRPTPRRAAGPPAR